MNENKESESSAASLLNIDVKKEQRQRKPNERSTISVKTTFNHFLDE